MALRPIGSDKASDPLGLRQLKDWGRGVAAELGASRGGQENRSGGGTVASEQVAWAHADGFRAYFKHREEYSTSSKLVVTAGRVHGAKTTLQATATATEITLPVSGNLYVYVVYAVSSTPTATITSNATQPNFHASPAVFNFVLGVLTETSTGKWSWTSWHEGDIFLDAPHSFGFWAKITSGVANPYSWTMLNPDATTDASPSVTGSSNLYEINGFTGYLKDQVVWVHFDGTSYRFSHHHRAFFAKITAETSSGVYSWTELQPNASTTTTRTGTSAQEVHGRAGIPVDTIVLMCQGPGPADYRFVDDSGEPGSVQDKSFTGNHQEAVRTSTSWDRTNQGTDRGTKRTICTGVEYNDAGDEILYAYYEDWTFDADGHLVLISAERRENIDTPEICT